MKYWKRKKRDYFIAKYLSEYRGWNIEKINTKNFIFDLLDEFLSKEINLIYHLRVFFTYLLK